ncbi:hypothetical protein [Kutzneria sp. CA-103260]|uniref:hypothetical protein n=1 Tax=Kutzneria sp. CA-103260 TaxID=2802641 RepID=UPI001BAA831B|nr:hypothetical protein [Kutzneria sp. CA-103260]QUQ62953.1 hypothetical protein JJ691_06650 [Kutzneria sp. CA-103260]
MSDLSNEQRADLAGAVERLAWATARETLGSETDAEPRQLWLATLGSLLAIRDSAERLAASAALSAAEHGADYPAIGAAAGMTRQGARRKWPGLAGLSDGRQRKLTWWAAHGDEFVDCVRAVVESLGGQAELPWLDSLRVRLAEIDAASTLRLDVLDLMMIDAHAVALNAPADPGLVGLLAALTADSYAATNGHSALISPAVKACGTRDCPSEPIVELLDAGHPAVPACRRHAVEALRRSSRIVTAYRPDVALSVFAEAAAECP